MRKPEPYAGTLCTRRDHHTRQTIAEDDKRRYACDCGLTMIGNGHVEIRYGLLAYLYPEPADTTEAG